jgi:hypothetical protein
LWVFGWWLRRRRQRLSISLCVFAHNEVDAKTAVTVFSFRKVAQVIENWDFKRHAG